MFLESLCYDIYIDFDFSGWGLFATPENQRRISESMAYGPTITTGLIPPTVIPISDLSGTTQLFQLYFCLDHATSEIIDCPILLPSGSCSSDGIKFPIF